MTMSRELRALDAMNHLGQWMKLATPDREVRVMDAMNNLEL